MGIVVTLAADLQNMSSVIDILVVLATAAVVAIGMHRMRLAVIPGYLLAGALLGPNALAVVRSIDVLEAISQLAIVLLLFGIGLHLQFSALGRNAVRLIAVGLGSCAVSILIGWPTALAFGLSSPIALTICMALSLSSTAVVLRIITERGELRHISGQLALSILVVQDLVVVPMLAALPAIARWAGTGGLLLVSGETGDDAAPAWSTFLLDATIRVGGIALIILAGKAMAPWILKEAARERSGEVMMIIAIVISIAAGVATQALGFSMELGAFLAGFLLAATPFRHQLSGQIAPLRDLFMAVFFTTLGMQLDIGAVAEVWWIILLAGAIMTGLKVVSIGGVSWALGAPPAIAAAVGLALAQGGEFGLILIGSAQSQGILDDVLAARIIAIIIISLILTPALVEVGRRLQRSLEDYRVAPWIRHGLQAKDQKSSSTRRRGHVIIGGYGPTGRVAARTLEQIGMGYSVVELNPETVRGELRSGRSMIYGDVKNPQVLESAGLGHADALILTMPDELASFAAVALAKRRKPDIFVVVRVSLVSHGRMAKELGADYIVIEEVEVAKALQEVVMERFGLAGKTGG